MEKNKNFIITLTGDPGSGKSTTYAQLKKCFESEGYDVIKYSTGAIFRKYAQKWIEKNPGTDISDFNKYVESHPEIDKLIDDEVKKINIRLKENYQPNKIFIIDSRMAWKFIPDSLKVRLTIDKNISGKRIFEDSTRDIEDTYSTLEEAIQATVTRKESERQRYLKLYNVDLEDKNNYDLVIDTSHADIKDIVETIYRCAHLKMEDKHFEKKWKNPKYFLPTQNFRDCSSKKIDEILNSIKDNNYDTNSLIYSTNFEGYDYVLDGHHRVISSILAEKTLIPYETHKGNYEEISCYNPSYAYDIEDIANFRYTEVYNSYPNPRLNSIRNDNKFDER